MDARRPSAARPASESLRGRKPRATAMRYGDLIERPGAVTGCLCLFFVAAAGMLAVMARKAGCGEQHRRADAPDVRSADKSSTARPYGRSSKTAPFSTAGYRS